VKTLLAASLLFALVSPAYAAKDVSWLCANTDDEYSCVLEGMRDYRAGQCFRARPYSDDSWEGKLWKRGYYAHQTKKQGKRNDEHCYGTRGQH